MTLNAVFAIIALCVVAAACSGGDDERVTEQSADAKTGSEFDFRKTTWGMSKEEVKASEIDQPQLEEENTLDYATLVDGNVMQYGYTFKDDKLYRAGYYLLTPLEDKQEYIDIYMRAKENLIDQYGPPVVDAEEQVNRDAEIKPDERAEAVCRGDMLYGAQWNLPRTGIQLILRGEDSKCHFTIMYVSNPQSRSIGTNGSTAEEKSE